MARTTDIAAYALHRLQGMSAEERMQFSTVEAAAADCTAKAEAEARRAEQIEALREAIRSARSMVDYYDTTARKAQNAAMEAAGLPPLHKPSDFAWLDQQKPVHERRAAALEGLLNELSGDDQAQAPA